MLVKAIFLFIIIIICALTVIVSIIGAIVKRNNKQVRDAWIITAIVFLTIGIGTGIYTTIKIFYVTIDKGGVVFNDVVEFLGEHLAGRHPDSYFLDSIKGMQPKDISVPSPYFYCAGLRDYYRMPLIYPYSLSSIDDMKDGSVNDESGISNIFNDSNSSQCILYDITKLSYNQDFLVAELENDSLSFAILRFSDGNIMKFETKEKLEKHLKENNVNLPSPMMTIREYYSKFY